MEEYLHKRVFLPEVNLHLMEFFNTGKFAMGENLHKRNFSLKGNLQW